MSEALARAFVTKLPGLGVERKPQRCANLTSRFLTVGQKRIWLCDEHFRMHRASMLTEIETRDQQIVLVDCRTKGS